MKLYHHTSLGRSHPLNILEWNSEYNDYVWTRIYWLLVSRDIDLNNENGDRKIANWWYTDFPDPDPNNFIPSDNVTDRDLLRWIHETEGRDSICEKQTLGATELIGKYNYVWNEPHL